MRHSASTNARRLSVGLLFVAGLAARPSYGCASCGCGDPTLTAMGVEKPYTNRVRLSLEERFGSHVAGVGDATDRTFTLRSMFVASWSPSSWVTASLSVPVVAEWVQAGSGPLQNFAGLGDVETAVRVTVFRDRKFSPRHMLSVLTGLKMPTGPRVYDAEGYPFADDDQPGSGSWDPFFGATYGWFSRTVSLFSSVGYRYTTVGRRGYRKGSTFGASAGVQFQPWKYAGVALSTDLYYADSDVLPNGVNAPNTGGAMLALTPAFVVSPTENWILRLAGQVHVHDWLNGQQTESNAVILSTVVDLN